MKRVAFGEPVIKPLSPRREAVDDRDRRGDARSGVASPVLLEAYDAPPIRARFSFRTERSGPPLATPSNPAAKTPILSFSVRFSHLCCRGKGVGHGFQKFPDSG
jgi:hypothetical protein